MLKEKAIKYWKECEDKDTIIDAFTAIGLLPPVAQPEPIDLDELLGEDNG